MSYPAIEIQNIIDIDPVEILIDYNNSETIVKKKRFQFEITSKKNGCYFQEELFHPVEIRLTGPLHRKENDRHSHELVIKHTNENEHLYMCFFVYNDNLPNYTNLFSLNTTLDGLFSKPLEKEELALQSLLCPLENLDKMYYQTKNQNHVVVFTNALYTSKLSPIQYSQRSAQTAYKEIYLSNHFDILSLFSLDTKIQSIFPGSVLTRTMQQNELEGFRGRKKKKGGARRRQRRRRRDAAKGAAIARDAEQFIKNQINTLVPGFVRTAISDSIASNQSNIKTMTLPNNYMECDLLEDNGKDVYKDTIVMPLGAGAYEQGATMFMSFLYFFLIGAVISIGSPYLTLIAIKHVDNSYSTALTIVWGILLLIGVILIAVALAPKTKVIDKNGKEKIPPGLKKLTKKKRILISTLGFFFMVMFGFSFLSNTIAKMSGMSYGPGYSYSSYYDKEKINVAQIFDIYAMTMEKPAVVIKPSNT